MLEENLKGAYVLHIEVPKDQVIRIGSLGPVKFRKGYYAYVGSALGGIDARVSRHMRREKKIRWHIDYLLEGAKVLGAVCLPSDVRTECLIAEGFRSRLDPVPGFGCSDCRCLSHLFYSRNLGDLRP
jgi:sugar fermentation stimulation protein A